MLDFIQSMVIQSRFVICLAGFYMMILEGYGIVRMINSDIQIRWCINEMKKERHRSDILERSMCTTMFIGALKSKILILTNLARGFPE